MFDISIDYLEYLFEFACIELVIGKNNRALTSDIKKCFLQFS